MGGEGLGCGLLPVEGFIGPGPTISTTSAMPSNRCETVSFCRLLVHAPSLPVFDFERIPG